MNLTLSINSIGIIPIGIGRYICHLVQIKKIFSAKHISKQMQNKICITLVFPSSSSIAKVPARTRTKKCKIYSCSDYIKCIHCLFPPRLRSPEFFLQSLPLAQMAFHSNCRILKPILGLI